MNNNNITLREKKFYNLLLVLQPILAVYASPIAAIDLGTAVCVCWGIYVLCKVRFRILKNSWLIAILVYTTLITFMNVATTPSIGLLSSRFSIIVRFLRFIVMLVIMIIIGVGGYFDLKLALVYLRRISLIVACYAVLQLIFFRFTGLKLINVFGPTKQGVEFNSSLDKYETTYRPPSFFLEPSSAVYFLIPSLCFALFSDKDVYPRAKMQTIDAVIITVGIISTTSGQGIVVLSFVWIAWYFYKIFLKVEPLKWLFVTVIFAIGFYIAINNENVIYSFSRIFDTGNEISAVEARASGYDAFNYLDPINQIFGTGYGNYNEDIYYSSIADILCCTGIGGLLVVGLFYLNSFFRGNMARKMLVISSIVLMLGGGVYTATYLCLYLPFIVCNETLRNKRKKTKRLIGG